MPQVNVSVAVPRSAGDVFAFLVDGCNLARWHSGVAEIRAERGGGETYRYRFPGRRRETRLERRVDPRGRRVSFVGERLWTPLGSQVPQHDFRVAPRGDGCHVDIRVSVRLWGGMVALWPVVEMGWRRDLPEDARRLHRVLSEGGGPR
ncbi:SRPBCC family protein [Streptomyces sp. MUM 203J]|uniref:SRPBCC family protein n=1 Tax=Streptomyces sp. MUM 203J TaxID=2791990 RepID=UPI001F049B3B|nr:SRPBCC family protein [Streptomyces sp. MUM 203J]MCH0540128.1 SRPBCC family protein [Streptomyces sp. MUM 203J]